MKTWSYYVTQRYPEPGAVPRDGLVLAVEYGKREFIDKIGRKAYGHAFYNRPLTEKEISDYELTPAPEMRTAD